MPLLQVKGLVKYYSSRAVVNGVDFEVSAGEVVGLLGPNGAGKTTSFRMATGQIEPDAGTVFFNGEDVTGLPMYMRARIGMGYLPQETSVFRRLSVEDNILAVLELLPMARTLGRSLTSSERHDRMEAAIKRFALEHVRTNIGTRLSGGEKRRLEIARCLVCEPLLILLDEPFTGIDPITIAEIRQIILELRKEGIGILLTDHNVHEALKITTRSYLIKDGKVRTQGTPAQIVRDPIAIAEYLGAGFSDNNYRSPEEHAPAPTANEPRKITKPAVEAPKPTLEFSPPPAPKPVATPAQLILEKDKIQRLVESLRTNDHARAADELAKKGMTAIPALLAAIERRDPELRQCAVDVLQTILSHPIPFDAFAPESTRKQQLAALRDLFERKAG